MSWIDILKSNQITVGSTTLDTRALPEEEEDNECWKKLMQMKEEWESATQLFIPNITAKRQFENFKIPEKWHVDADYKLEKPNIPPEEVACWVIDEYKKFNLGENIFSPGGYFKDYFMMEEGSKKHYNDIWTLWIGNDAMINENMASNWQGIGPFFISTLRDKNDKILFGIGSEVNWHGQYPDGHTQEDEIDLIWYRLLTEHMYHRQTSHDFSFSADHYGVPEPEDIVKLFQLHLDWRKYLR
tara:strand:+ start:834 stop:1559 length:726 start_codon:yes stop_codon:yes gene_type:complete